MSLDFSLYLHIPFCLHRCAYCDFNTYAGQDHYRAAYVDALCAEIHFTAQTAESRLRVHTVFFGGGTPSLLLPAEMDRIMAAIAASYDLTSTAEISLEANPGTLSLPYLKDLRAIGFNRISLGMQSANPDDLRLLERQHSYPDVIQSVKWARQAGWENLNLDLMFGLPHQSLPRWRNTLELALVLNPEHLSLYALTLEHGTPFQRWTERGLIPEADGDLAADMYDWAEDRLAAGGFHHYEISNWARAGSDGAWLSCRHNLQYWRNQPYLGFGAGAHGYAGGFRTANVLGILPYIQRCSDIQPQTFPITPATASLTAIDRHTEMQETMMVGLRLVEDGVSARRFARRFDEPLIAVFGRQIDRLIDRGLLEWSGPDRDALRLTQRGHLVGNQVFMQFVGD